MLKTLFFPFRLLKINQKFASTAGTSDSLLVQYGRGRNLSLSCTDATGAHNLLNAPFSWDFSRLKSPSPSVRFAHTSTLWNVRSGKEGMQARAVCSTSVGLIGMHFVLRRSDEIVQDEKKKRTAKREARMGSRQRARSLAKSRHLLRSRRSSHTPYGALLSSSYHTLDETRVRARQYLTGWILSSSFRAMHGGMISILNSCIAWYHCTPLYVFHTVPPCVPQS